MLTLTLFLGIIFLEAFYETQYDSGHKTLSGLVEFVLRAIMFLALAAWMAGIEFSKLWVVDIHLGRLVLGYAFVRWALFSMIYNLFRSDIKLDIFYVGNTKLFDKVLKTLLEKSRFPIPPFLGITKLISLIVGIDILQIFFLSKWVTIIALATGVLLPFISWVIYKIKKK